ncbi:AraC family transcriptional regulator [Erythrobacter sp. GH1-10]|uniref:AraC family transcriptional regulator n=1 Tax=Erythrobacter sp. GH1-10 TaxID=3349334 RepID=UPI003877ABF6
MTEATVSAGVAKGLIDFAVKQGVDRDSIHSQAGIHPSSLTDHDDRIEMARYRALVSAAQQLSGNPAIALHYAEQVDLSELSLVGLITRSAPTMQDALIQLNRYGQLVVDIDTGAAQRFEIVREDGEIWLVDNRRNPNDFPELTEVTFTRLICGPRRFTDELALRSIEFTHAAPPYAAEYDRIFQAPVTFESYRNAMQLDEGWLTHPVALTPSYMFGILTREADGLLASLQAQTTFKAQVQSLLMPQLHSGEASVGKIAAEMGMSRQTLYRKLKQEGTTFKEVLDELRCKLALDYIEGRKVSVNQAAYLTGFSDPSAFTRAFRRWTGKSPRTMMREAETSH